MLRHVSDPTDLLQGLEVLFGNSTLRRYPFIPDGLQGITTGF